MWPMAQIGKVVLYLPDKKNKISLGSSARTTARIAPKLSGPAPDNVLRVLQISSKSVRFRRSYIRTRDTVRALES